MMLLVTSCGGSDSEELTMEIDPSNPDELSRAIVIQGNVVTGTPPASSTSSNAPNVSNNQSAARITNDNVLALPFSYSSTTTNGYGGCYVQVNGASTYWDIPSTGSTQSSGQIILPVGIPATVLDGNFTIVYCIYDSNGLVSNVLSTNVTIAPPKTCPGFESGSDGLTIFEYDLGSNSGDVTISYDTYSVPDRIDVLYNDVWVDGTGSSLGSGQFPPQLNCNNATVSDGFVGERGTFTVNHNPANGSKLKIYVSGCIGSSTAWDIQVSCPQ